MLFQFSTAGTQALATNFTGVVFTQVRFGSGVNYAPVTNPLGLVGSTVYTTVPSNAVVVDTNTIRYTVLLDTTVGPFNFGEVGFYVGNQLYAVGVVSTLIEKIRATGALNGNSIVVNLFITKSSSGFYGAVDFGNSDNSQRFPGINTPDSLVPPAQLEANAFVVRGIPGIETPYLAVADGANGLWSFSNRPRQAYQGAVASINPLGAGISAPHNMVVSVPGNYVLQFTSGKLRGYCRQLSNIVSLGFQWANSLLVLPEVGDTFIVLGPQLDLASISGGAENLNDLADVVTVNSSVGDVLTFSTGGMWKNKPPASSALATLTDVDLTVAPTSGQILQYDLPTSKWKAGSFSSLAQHNALGGLQGGQTAQYYHISGAEYTFLQGLTTALIPYKNTPNTFQKGQTVTPITLTASNGYSIVGSQSNNWTCVLTANAVLPNPTAMTDGQVINITFVQDAVGNHSVTFGPAFAFTGSAVPSIASGANQISVLSGIYNATLSKLVCAIASGALTSYTLPPATAASLGGIKVGNGLAIDTTGLLSVNSAYALPAATSSILGGVKVGSGLAVAGDGTLSATPASPTTLGGIKVGSGLSIDELGVLSSAASQPATSTSTGVVKPGLGLSVFSDGTLEAVGARPLVNYASVSKGAVASVSTAVSSQPAINAIDNNDTTFTLVEAPVTNAYVTVALDKPYRIYGWRLLQSPSSAGTQFANIVNLSYYDGSTWVVVDTFIISGAADTLQRPLSSTLPAAQQWRVTAINGSSGQWKVFSLALFTYVEPGTTVATATSPGIVSVGSGLSVNSSGVLSANATSVPLATATSVGVAKFGTGLTIDSSGLVTKPDVIATSTTLGLVKIGDGVLIDSTGAIKVTVPTLPIASTIVLGGVKAGTGVTIDSAGVLNATGNYTLPTASDTVLGGIKAGAGITVDPATGLASVAVYTLPPATNSVIGGVKPGSGLNIASDGTINADAYSLPIATSTVLGGLKVGTGFTVGSAGVLNVTPYVLPVASSSILGGVKAGSGLSAAGDGTLSVNFPSATIASPSILGSVKVGTGLAIDGTGTLTATASSYTLPTATAIILGGVKVGANVSVAGDGTISVAAPYSLPTASSTVLGGVKVGTGLTVDGTGTLTATASSYTLPTATTTTLGGVTVGTNLAIDGSGVLSGTYSYTLPIASASTLGGIKVGANLSIDASGVLSGPTPAGTYTLPAATASVLGGVKVGANVSVAGDGTISVAAPYSLPTASSTVLGGVKVGTGLAIDGSGVLSSTGGGGATALTTKGDLLGFDTAANRIPIGTNGQVLTADSTQALGLKWAAASGGSVTLDSIGVATAAATLTGYSPGGTNPGGDITITPGSGSGSSTHGGYLTLNGGPGGAGTGSVGGTVYVKGGVGNNGGSVAINGTTGTTSDGGGISITAGNSAYQYGVTGAVSIAGGSGSSGGNVTISGGTTAFVSYGVGGDVLLKGGPAGTSSTPGNVVTNGAATALPTTATGGFVTFPTTAGMPTGTPSNLLAGNTAFVYDSTNKIPYYYAGGSWTPAVTAASIPQNSQSAAYTTVLSDAGKHLLHPAADTSARTFTIDSNANVAYPIGTALTFVNQNAAGVVTIAITTDTMRLAGAGTTGSRTLAANGVATALKITSTEWIISGTNLT